MAGLGFEISVEEKQALDSLKNIEREAMNFEKAMLKVGKTMDLAFEGKSLKEYEKSLNSQRKVVADLEKQYESAKATFDKLNIGTNDIGIIEQRKAASTLFKQIRADLDAENKILEKQEKGFKAVADEMDKLSGKSVSYLTEMKNIRQEMVKLTNADGSVNKENEAKYDKLKDKLSEVGTAYRRVQQEQKLLTTVGSATLSGLIQGVTGVAGAFTAAQGVASLFVKDNERLAAIQTKLQAAMSITIGLQQVSNTIHATSAFRIGFLSKVTNVLSIANLKLATALGVSTAAAKVFMAAMTLGLSAAITGVIYLINSLTAASGNAAETMKKFNQSAAENAASQRASFEKLRQEWVLTGNDLKKKEKLVRDNTDAYNSFGVKIRDVADAERMFVNDADAFVRAINKRAIAAAAMELAADKYKEAIEKMMNAENLKNPDNASSWTKFKASVLGVFTGKSNEDSLLDILNDEIDTLESGSKKAQREVFNIIAATLGLDGSTSEELKKLGYQTSDSITDGSKEYWQKIRDNQQKIMDENLPASDVFKAAKKQRDAAAKMLEQWDKTNFNKEDSTAKQAAQKANAITEQEEKLRQIIERLNTERKRLSGDLENQEAQARIDAMADGAKKVRAQIELDNRLELEALERQKEDYIREYTRQQKEVFEAQEDLKAKQNDKYIKQVFDASTIKIDTSIFDKIFKNIQDSQNKGSLDSIDKSWNEYFLKFGNYQEKRTAIIEKGNRELAEAINDGEKAIIRKNTQDAIDTLDNSVKGSTTLLGQLFADTSKKSVNEIESIIDKVELLMRYLEAAKDTQGNAIIDGKAVSKSDILGLGISENTLENLQLSVEEIEALRSALDKMKGDLGGKSPFKLFGRQISDAIAKIREGGKNNISQGIIEISGAINQVSPYIKEFGNSLGTLFGDDKIGQDIGLVIDGIEGVGTAAAGVGKIMSGDVVGGVMDVVNGAAKAVEAFGSLFGPDGTAYYEGIKNQLDAINEIYDKIIAKNKEDITFGGGFASIQAASDAIDIYYKKLENLQKTADASGRAGSSWKSHSAEWHSNKNVGADNFNKMSQIVGKSIKSMNDLYNLTGDELYLLQSQMPEAWSKIDARILENLNSIVDCKDEARELQASLNEALTGVSQDSFYNDFINNLSNLEMSFEDMCNNFEDDLRKSIMAGLVADQYKERINALYEEWARAAESDEKITKNEADKLREDYNKIVQDMLKERDDLIEAFGWDTDSPYSQSGSKGYSVSMSQDTGDMLVGINTGVLEGVISIRESLKMMESMSVSNKTNINSIAQDMQLLVDSNFKSMYYLQDIATYTKVLPNMASDMEQVKKNTGKLFGT